ncbi:MAG: hypothetical protein ACE5IR_05975 [bacterium]
MKDKKNSLWLTPVKVVAKEIKSPTRDNIFLPSIFLSSKFLMANGKQIRFGENSVQKLAGRMIFARIIQGKIMLWQNDLKSKLRKIVLKLILSWLI